MDALIYLVVLFSSAVALVSLSYVWCCALGDALRGPDPAEGSGARRRRLLLVALGWPGALVYWLRASRADCYSRTRVQ